LVFIGCTLPRKYILANDQHSLEVDGLQHYIQMAEGKAMRIKYCLIKAK